MKKIIILFVILTVAVASLVFVLKHGSQPISHASLTETVRYQCPMHPQIIQDHPGNCPICGMTLNKIENFKPDFSNLEKHAPVRLTPEKIQTIGIRTEKVQIESLILPLRLTGVVFHNHEIFELLSAYRNAIQVEQRIQKPTPELVAQSRARANTIRNQLRRIGISDEAFKQIEQGLADPSSFIPAHLILAAGGAYVDAQMSVSDSTHLKVGQKAKLSSKAFEGRVIEGIVKSVDSLVDTATQTVGVRIEVQMNHELMKPGLFVDIEMDLDLGQRLVVSNSALFSPGKNTYVFVEKETGLYLPKWVQTGISTSEKTEVISGLAEGEAVVVSANFLLDSESRFQAVRRGEL